MGDPSNNTALHHGAARQLATTTKSKPQIHGLSPRWLLRRLPWMETQAGVLRINRRRRYPVGPGHLQLRDAQGELSLQGAQLRELPMLRGFEDLAVLDQLASAFELVEIEAETALGELGQSIAALTLIGHGRVEELHAGEHGQLVQRRLVGEGTYLGEGLLVQPGQALWSRSYRTRTATRAFVLGADLLQNVLGQYPALAAHISAQAELAALPQDKYNQPEIAIESATLGESTVPGSFVDYELDPLELELSCAQVKLHVQARVLDLYNTPHDQLDTQLTLKTELLRERQEFELINNRQFGLLNNVDPKQRVYAAPGPLDLADLDELLCKRRGSDMLLAHPRTITAIARAATRAGLYPDPVVIDDKPVFAWRGVPVFPTNKIPISSTATSSILCMRTGLERQGVVGVRQIGLPDEREPGLSVRFMNISDSSVVSYLITTYFSLAKLVPDAVGVLDGVEIAR